MTEKTPETSSSDTLASGSSHSAGHVDSSTSLSAKKTRPGLMPALVAVVIIAVLLAAAVWYQQEAFKRSYASLTEQLQTSASAANQANEQAQQALSLSREQAAQIDTLQRSLKDSREQVRSLEQAFQTLTDSGSDLVLLNDVDHLVTIAQQQLQLGGNVANAIISLETAQAQLARANRPALASLQQTLNGDLDRLRAVSTVDLAFLSSQLDELSTLLAEAPLLVPDDAAPGVVNGDATSAPTTAAPARAASSSGDSWWRNALDTARDWSSSAWSSVREDLGQFISVRRVGDPAALLMSPDQAARFRDNLRLRIMTAQLALMMHQPRIWTSETAALLKSVEMRYDAKDARSRRAIKIARQMADTSIDVKLPTVDNTIKAIETLREDAARDAEQGETAEEPTPGSSPNGDAAVPDSAKKSGDGDAAAPDAAMKPAEGDAAPAAPTEAGAAPAPAQDKP